MKSRCYLTLNLNIDQSPCFQLFYFVNFAVPTKHRSKFKECEKRDKYNDLAWEWKKTVKHRSDGDTNCHWCSLFSHKRIGTRTGGLGNNRMNGDHPNYSIIKIGQNTEKSPRDLRKPVVA